MYQNRHGYTPQSAIYPCDFEASLTRMFFSLSRAILTTKIALRIRTSNFNYGHNIFAHFFHVFPNIKIQQFFSLFYAFFFLGTARINLFQVVYANETTNSKCAQKKCRSGVKQKRKNHWVLLKKRKHSIYHSKYLLKTCY